MGNEIQQMEVDWYRIRGKYPERRIKKTLSGEPYVVGDISWNQNPANPTEYFEGEVHETKKEIEVQESAERDEKIYLLRLGGLTLDEIGQRFGVSRERVRQICKVREGATS